MKKMLLSAFACALIFPAFANEHRILIPSDDCSGKWSVVDLETHKTIGHGTYSHCSNSNSKKSDNSSDIILTQGKNDDFVHSQPLVESNSAPTKKDVAKVIKSSPELLVFAKPGKNNSNFTLQLSESYQGTATYSIIGYDGIEYVSSAKSQLNNHLLELSFNPKKSGSYFIILTYGDKTVSNNFKVL